MSDQDDTQPSPTVDGAKTANLPVISPEMVAITHLSAAVEKGFARTDQGIEQLHEEGKRTSLRLTRQEVRMDEVETRLASNSMRAKGQTQADLAISADLAQERSAREALATEVADLKATNATQLAILGRLDKVASNPTVKLILFALGTIATGYLASKGLR